MTAARRIVAEKLNPVQFERHSFGGAGFPSSGEMERTVI
jgi:hypothetical protein